MTIVLDTSAVAAIVFGEDDAQQYAAVIRSVSFDIALSAATMVEASMVVEGRQGLDAVRSLHELLDVGGVTVEPFTVAQADAAVAAWRRFGKGRHPAALNLGDCYSYALAKVLDAALLFKGDDFLQTDVRPALS